MLKNDNLRRKEHEAIRNAVGYYNFTHQLLLVKGKDAADFLDKIYVNSIKNTKIGRAKYTTMLDNNGKIIDDVIVFRMEEELFWISTLYIDNLIKWFDKNKGNCEVEYENITNKVSMYAIQGPNSKKLLDRILEHNIDGMKFFEIKDNKINDINVKVARSGFTGEIGYEIYLNPKDNEILENILEKEGKDLGILKITTDVIIGSIPGEKGYVLMSDIGGNNPFEVDFGWTVDLNKDFIGKEETLKIKDTGGTKRLLGFELKDNEEEVSPKDKVFVNGKEVGEVTKFTYGYTIDKAIGYVLVDKVIKVNTNCKIGDKDAIIVDRIWYDKENKNQKL